MKRLIPALALVVAIAGCGDDDSSEPAADEPEVEAVASLEETEPSESPSTSARPLFSDALLLFTGCLRDHGIEAPDIPVDPDGRAILSSDLVEQIDTESPEFAVAFAMCMPFLTSASAIDLGADPELQAVVIDSLRRFSSCMRENGVEEFPDPAPGWDGNGSPFPVAEAFDMSDPDVDAALEECSGLISFPSGN
ncbi:MAG: hypothetical protein OXF41_13535 [bacterium]|nr:hypothetical protein [bacterium]